MKNCMTFKRSKGNGMEDGVQYLEQWKKSHQGGDKSALKKTNRTNQDVCHYSKTAKKRMSSKPKGKTSNKAKQ